MLCDDAMMAERGLFFLFLLFGSRLTSVLRHGERKR